MSIKNRGTGQRTARLFGAGLRTLGRTVLKKIPGGDRVERTARYWADVGEDWTRTLGDLRGAAMKLGQLASQYSDVLPPALADQLRLLQRSVKPLPFDQIKPILDAQWTPAQRRSLASIEPEAIAAASIGQVHRAVLKDGRAVVIKLRYPGVGEAVDSDLAQLRRLIGLSKLLPLDNAAMDRLMAEVRERFREETDYAAELAHLQYLRVQASRPGLVFPTPIESLCTDGILVMSEEAGEPLEVAKGWPQDIRDAIGETLCRWVTHGLFVANAVHADPHPGNFAFREDGTVVVYDFGCVKRVPPAVAERVKTVLNTAARHDWRGLHEAQIELDGIADGAQLDELIPLYSELEALITGRLAQRARFDFSDESFITDIRAAIRRHLEHSFKFRPVSDLIFVVRALSGLYWNARALGARVPVAAILRDHGVELSPARG
ncbi:MAG: AarF/ABC1/UbiB kinase family protein [Nevskia sp.]